MFTSTMTDAEIQKEARKDFFELSTKVGIAADRYLRKQCDLINNSPLEFNNKPVNLIKKSVENRMWKTRRNNIWTSSFRFKNDITGVCAEIYCYLYTHINRTYGTEYIFLRNLDEPVAERFTMHFIERYKERHLRPHNIELGAMPAPLYFQIHNPDCILGKYYKTSDLDIAESKNKSFWIAPEGIYVTDYIDGMLTYITFMDKDDLSPLKQQVYEEEIVWNLIATAGDETLSETERMKAVYGIASSPDLGGVFERFANRNIKHEGDEDKRKFNANMRKLMTRIKKAIDEKKSTWGQKEKLSNRKDAITGAFDIRNIVDDEFIKRYQRGGL